MASKGSLWRRLKRRALPRTIWPTREGRYYVGLTLGIGFAAINTGNNLLFLSFGMLLSFIILSGLLSEAALRKLDIRRVAPSEARAGDPVLVSVRVRNGNRVLPSVGLVIEEDDPVGADTAPVRVVQVPAGHTAHLDMRVTPAARGPVRLQLIKVTTRYPFGIFSKSRIMEAPVELLAFPRRVPSPLLENDPGHEEGGPCHARRGAGDELHGLRPYRDGDDAKHIHWRRSLRVERLLVLEREAPRGRRVTLGLPPVTGEAFEEAVRVTAARAEDHLARGDEVALSAPGAEVPFGRGPGHRRRILSALALVQPPAAGEGATDARSAKGHRAGAGATDARRNRGNAA